MVTRPEEHVRIYIVGMRDEAAVILVCRHLAGYPISDRLAFPHVDSLATRLPERRFDAFLYVLQFKDLLDSITFEGIWAALFHIHDLSEYFLAQPQSTVFEVFILLSIIGLVDPYSFWIIASLYRVGDRLLADRFGIE